MLKLEPIEISHKSRFDRFKDIYPTQVSELTFTNLFIWRRSRPIFISENENFLVSLTDHGDFYTLFGPPFGKINLSEINTLLKDTIKPVVAFERIPKKLAQEKILAEWFIQEDRNNFDYVYSRKALTELAGRNFHAKRNLIAQCLSKYECKYEEMNSKNIPEVAAMMKRWCEKRECGKNPGLCSEYMTINENLNNFEKLDSIGAIIRIDDQIAAFTIGEALNKNTAVVHFEKAMPEFIGLYQVINQMFCQNHLSQFEFINREQDLGIEGLKKAKESYFPDHMVEKYIVYQSPEFLQKLRSTKILHECENIES